MFFLLGIVSSLLLNQNLYPTFLNVAWLARFRLETPKNTSDSKLILCTDSGMITVVKEEQPLNARLPIFLIVEGNVTLVMSVFSNALYSILVTPSGITTSPRSFDSPNNCCEIMVTPAGQGLGKELSPDSLKTPFISLRLAGRLIDDREMHPKNAPPSMLISVLGRVTEASFSHRPNV